MLAMLKRVFQILQGADKALYQSLKASLTTESSSGEDNFAIRLVPLLHPYVQRLFVGMLTCMSLYMYMYECVVFCGICGCMCYHDSKRDYSFKSPSQLWILS